MEAEERPLLIDSAWFPPTSPRGEGRREVGIGVGVSSDRRAYNRLSNLAFAADPAGRSGLHVLLLAFLRA